MRTDFFKKIGSSCYVFRREGGKAVAVKDPRIAALNRLWKAKTIDREKLVQSLNALIVEFKAAEKPEPNRPITSSNREVIEKYLLEHYGRRKILPDSRRSWKSRLERAIACLGQLDLLSASIGELQHAIDQLAWNRQRYAATALNSVLKWLKREEFLTLAQEERPEISFIQGVDFPKLLEAMPDNFSRTLVACALYTGCRIGELFALTQFSLKEGGLYVESQYRIDLARAKQKNKRPHRWAGILPEGRNPLKLWVEISIEERLKRRNNDWARIIKRACRKAQIKQITFHDLRHSYAIECLRRGKSLTAVAQSLGNSVTVCEKYYAGFGEAPSHLSEFAKK